MIDKKTVIIGASPNPSRYAFMAAHRLQQHNHTIVPLGIKKGEVAGSEIQNLKEKPLIEDVDTVTMYIGSQHQSTWEDYIISLSPNRVIFNPGTENPTFYDRLEQVGIEPIEACTLVMLSVGDY